MKKVFLSLGLAAALVVPYQVANAFVIGDSTTLSSWNDSALNASGDYIQVNTGTTNYYGTSDNWFSLRWEPGSQNVLQALGLDTVFYNSTDTVSSVWLGGIGSSAGGTDVSTLWNTNYGGSTGGGGFGKFDSDKSLNSGTTEGINNTIYFVLNGTSGFTPNGDGAMFDAHVRYSNECSGWASDGTITSINSGTSCGGTTHNVPEPSSLLLLGAGLLGLGLLRRRKD